MSMNSVTKLQSKRFYVVMSYVILLQNLLNLLWDQINRWLSGNLYLCFVCICFYDNATCTNL